MKRRLPIFALLSLIVAAVWMLVSRYHPRTSTAPAYTRDVPNSVSSNATPAKAATTPENLDALTKSSAGQERIRQFREIWAAQNNTPQDFYGLVIDQYGQPITHASILGTLFWIQGFDIGEKSEQHSTTTDETGAFQFTGFRAARLAIAIAKDGYEIDQRGNAYRAPNIENKTSVTARAVFTMWKLQGAEPLLHNSFDARIPYDGRQSSFNLVSGATKESDELKITLSREPLVVRRGIDHFRWNLRIELAGGGIVEAAGPYYYLAPEQGYQTTFEFEQPSNTPQWTAQLTKTFYFRSAQNHFGRLLLDLATDSNRPDTGIHLETWLNTSGSRNLEFDPNIQIKSR